MVNTLGRNSYIDIAKTAMIDRGVVLRGNIMVGDGAGIKTGSDLNGDISVGDKAQIRKDSWVDGDVSLGRRSTLGDRAEVLAERGAEISIGRYNAIARRVTFQNRYHETSNPSIHQGLYRDILQNSRDELSKGPIRVGSDVWIGKDATVLSGVEIGHGAVVGANAVVTHDVPPYSIATGIPAEVTGERFEGSIREQLLEIQWWNWSEERIKRNREFFEMDLNTVSDVNDCII